VPECGSVGAQVLRSICSDRGKVRIVSGSAGGSIPWLTGPDLVNYPACLRKTFID